jgi:hypothetical protein
MAVVSIVNIMDVVVTYFITERVNYALIYAGSVIFLKALLRACKELSLGIDKETDYLGYRRLLLRLVVMPV